MLITAGHRLYDLAVTADKSIIALLDSLMQCLSLSDQVDYNLLHEHEWGTQIYVHSLCEYEVN